MEEQRVEAGDGGEGNRDGAGEAVAVEGNNFEAMEAGEGARDAAGEAVAAEVEEREEVRDPADEGVRFEAEHTELVHRSEELCCHGAGEVEELEDELGDPPIVGASFTPL